MTLKVTSGIQKKIQILDALIK